MVMVSASQGETIALDWELEGQESPMFLAAHHQSRVSVLLRRMEGREEVGQGLNATDSLTEISRFCWIIFSSFTIYL